MTDTHGWSQHAALARTLQDDVRKIDAQVASLADGPEKAQLKARVNELVERAKNGVGEGNQGEKQAGRNVLLLDAIKACVLLCTVWLALVQLQPFLPIATSR
jgi:hypothetical protein